MTPPRGSSVSPKPRTGRANRRRGKGDKFRGGPPSRISDVAYNRPNGEPVTIAEAIVERLRAGAYRDEAARSVGVHTSTFYEWEYKGNRARIDLLNGRFDRVDREGVAFAKFTDALERAEAEAVLTDWAQLGRLAQGGIPQERVTVKVKVNEDGTETEIERTTVTERTLPDVKALTWRMERRWPKLFGRRIAITGEDGGPVRFDIEDKRSRAEALVDALDELRRRQMVEQGAAGVLEAVVIEDLDEEDFPDPDAITLD